MSNVHVSITRVRAMHTTANVPVGLPLQHSTVVGTPETIASAAGNQVSTLEVAREVTQASDEPHSYIWAIVNSGADDIHVAFGPTPDATVASTRHRILANTVRYFSADKFADKVAIANA